MVKALLPSWRDGAARTAILDFVAAVTHPGGPDYRAPADRVAVFDNDGTLWVEQPLYVQGLYALDRAKRLGEIAPELAALPGYSAFVRQDIRSLAAAGKQAVVELLLRLHAHATEEQFFSEIEAWLKTARHPRFRRHFPDLVYQPMREFLDYLRANGFRVFVVTAGGADFVRTFCERAYGVPRENVIGSSCRAEFRLGDRTADVAKLAELLSFNEFAAKPVNIARHIGRRPILACGNSDGDVAMLQYVDSGPGRGLAMLLHHDDTEREYAYDSDSTVGHLEAGLSLARGYGWTMISMRSDWSRLFRQRPS